MGHRHCFVSAEIIQVFVSSSVRVNISFYALMTDLEETQPTCFRLALVKFLFTVT